MLPTIQIGPLAVQTSGLILLSGLWLGLLLAEKEAPCRSVDPAKLYNLAFIALAAGLIGGRMIFALRYWDAFAPNPVSLVSLNPGLFDPWGGLVCCLLAGLVYGQRQRMPLWPTLDVIAPGLAVLNIALGLAHFASGEAYGAVADLPWSISLWGANRHPSQLYETLAAVVILVLARPAGRLERNSRHGILFFSFIAMSAAARLFLETFRGDSPLLPGGFRTPQVIAWLILAFSLALVYKANNERLHRNISEAAASKGVELD